MLLLLLLLLLVIASRLLSFTEAPAAGPARHLPLLHLLLHSSVPQESGLAAASSWSSSSPSEAPPADRSGLRARPQPLLLLPLLETRCWQHCPRPLSRQTGWAAGRQQQASACGCVLAKVKG